MRFKITLLLYLSLFLSLSAGEELIDLEAQIDPALIELRHLVIPDHPHAFNPSLVRWKEGWLVCFREMRSIEEKLLSYLYLIELDRNFKPLAPAQQLEIEFPFAADGRLLFCGKTLYIVYGNHPPPKKGRALWRVWMAQIKQESDHFKLIQPTELSSFEGVHPDKDEKNWVPFFYTNELLLAYSIVPHRILLAKLANSTCQNFSLSPTKSPWKWGIIRGGTPALLINGHYLGFFHSSLWMASKQSKGNKRYHYFMGAYTFSAQPPFVLEAISAKPIIGPGFYSGKEYIPYWKKAVQVVFPGGIAQDGPYIWIAFGRQDHEMWFAKFHTKKLLKSLTPLRKATYEDL